MANDSGVESCENCGRPVLPTDSTCWHCGYTLPRRPVPAPKKRGKPATPKRERPAETAGGAGTIDYDLRAIAIYGALTLAVVVSLVWVMFALSRYPVLVRNASLALGRDWVAVTDADLRYTLSLPDDWLWIDMAYRDQADLLPEVLRRQPYTDEALKPLGDIAGDMTLVGAAIEAVSLENTDPKPFVLIGRSENLRQTDPQTALDLLAEQSFSTSEASIDRRLAGQAQARFNVLDLDRRFQCRYLFVAGGQQPGYFVAACAPQSRFAIIQRQLNDILNSFQLLVP